MVYIRNVINLLKKDKTHNTELIENNLLYEEDVSYSAQKYIEYNDMKEIMEISLNENLELLSKTLPNEPNEGVTINFGYQNRKFSRKFNQEDSLAVYILNNNNNRI